MKHFLSICLVICLGLTALAQTPKVLLIGIDGCRPDAMTPADTPHLDALIANGTYSLDALNTGITISGPGWASLLTGVWPEKHGVTNNAFTGQDFPSFPHLFQRIEEHNPDLQTVSISQWHPVNDEIATGVADVSINVDDHSDFVAEAAIEQLSSADPDAIFLHFDDVDHAGHSNGFSPTMSAYINAIETVDGAIGNVLDALYARPSYTSEDWVIIVSTDHGGIGFSHGGTSIEERTIFMIVSGDGIAQEEIAAPTVEIAVPPVFNCLGDTTELYFEGGASAQSTAHPGFDFDTSADFSIECRVRTTVSGDVAILTDKDWDSGLNPGWVFSFNVSGGPWKVNVGDGSNRVDIEGNDLSDGEWHMLSATFDRDGMLSIYEDGVLVGASSMANLDDITAAQQIFMGADINGAYGYTGAIAEARIFNGLLDPQTIADNACTPLDVTHPDFPQLISYWAMNEGSGNGLGNNGLNAIATAINGAQWMITGDTTYTTTLDYAETPRQVDFMVTALEHLCVPIDPSWDLDGEVLATSCAGIVDGLMEYDELLTLYPNPSTGLIVVEGEIGDEITVYDALGKKQYSQVLRDTSLAIDLSHLVKGTYLAETLRGKERLRTKLVLDTKQ